MSLPKFKPLHHQQFAGEDPDSPVYIRYAQDFDGLNLANIEYVE